MHHQYFICYLVMYIPDKKSSKGHSLFSNIQLMGGKNINLSIFFLFAEQNMK